MIPGIDLQQVLNELVDGVFICTKEGKMLYCNPSLSSILGYKGDEVKGKNLCEDLVERSLEWKALVSLVEQGSVIADYEMKFKRPDGAAVVASVSASTLRAPDGTPIGIIGVLRDITTRKSLENELREKAFKTDVINRIAKLAGTDANVKMRVIVNLSAELRKLINFDLLVVGLVEGDGRHVEVISSSPQNANAAKTLGIVLFEGSLAEKLKFAGGPIIADKYIGRRPFTDLAITDTTGISSMLSAPLSSRGRTLGYISIGSRAQNEYDTDKADTLQMIADQVAGLIDNLTLVASLEAKIRLQDSLARTGLSIQKAISTEQIYATIATNIKEVVPYSELSFYVVDWQKRMVYPIYAAGSWADEVMASPGTVDEGVVGVVAKSGVAEFTDDVDADPRSVAIPGVPNGHESMLAIPLIGAGGVLGVLELYRPRGQVFTIGDLEAGRLFAQQASVALENAKLVSQLQEVKREIEMMNDLMFHDINNFNFASVNYLEMACSSPTLQAADKVPIEKSLQLIRQTAALIDKVKKLTKIGGLNAKDFAPVDLSDVLRRTVSGLENSFPGRNIGVTLNVPDSCNVMANSLVEELFINLLSNSLKYDPHEEVEIEVDVEKILEDGRQFWRICISDRGHGVPDDKKQQLFQKYVRLRMDPKTPGTGLGLSICRALVDKFGGRIWVEDRVLGKSELGARFCVTLPAVKGN